MSLVDYASSSDDDVAENIEEQEDPRQEEEGIPQLQQQAPEHEPSLCPPIARGNQRSGLLLNQSSESIPQPLLSPQMEKLPDASLLLNSPTISLESGGGTDHASRVSAAIAESASRRKRDLNGVPSSSSLPRGKAPRGTLPNTKNVPDTDGGMLVPPQLRGRSNIVTEDIGKLFVRRQT